MWLAEDQSELKKELAGVALLGVVFFIHSSCLLIQIDAGIRLNSFLSERKFWH